MLEEVLRKFGFDDVSIETFGNGLINNTWKITSASNEFILQKINTAVFKTPDAIDSNISHIGSYLKTHFPNYLFVAPIISTEGKTLLQVENDGYYRMFPFVKNSFTKNVLETPEQAYEAAKQFGMFTKLLGGFDINKLQVTLPNFHNLSLRFTQFLAALENGNQLRIKEAVASIELLKSFSSIVKQYEQLMLHPTFKCRVTHHDTKISNVLFDKNDKGICVIDLDTVMPGHFISDVGDMMRTYLSPVNEEEADFSKIQIRKSFYEAIVKGYYSEMKDELTDVEKNNFFFAGCFMIYMQAIRFLTDYINDDLYYGAAYPTQNHVRAQNQIVLLQRLIGNQAVLQNME